MTLTIGTFRVDGALSSDRSDHASVERQLDDVVRGRLPLALDRLGSSMLGSDPAVVLVKTMEVEIDLDLAEPEGLMADRIAISVWDWIAAARHDGDNVLVFRSPVEHLAVFLVDLVEGRAWSRWYHRRFSGLTLLSTSAIIRTLAMEDPVVFDAAAALLPPAMLERVVARLSPADRSTTLTAMGAAAPTRFRKALRAGITTGSEAPDLSHDSAEHEDMTNVRFTTFAGAFLLLPSLVDCPATSPPHAAAARLRAVASVLGHDVSADPVIGELLAGEPGSADATSERMAQAGDPAECDPWLMTSGRHDEPVDLRSLGTADDFLLLRSAVGPDLPTLIVAAQLVRRFATGLVGMGESSVSYLRTAFLGTGARVTRCADRLLVAIEPPPLWMLLKLSGFDGRTMVLPWNNMLTVHLSLELR